jgi:hypothetical protein
MAEEFTRLREELRVLDGQIQAERNDENRHALHRSRLESERARLLVRMVEALAPTATTAAVPPAVASPAPYSIVLSPRLTCPKGWEVPAAIPVTLREPPATRSAGKRNVKPAGLGTMEEMITAVMQGGAWMRPNAITAAIRARYWKDAPRTAAPSVVWHLAQKGRLEKGDDGYRLPIPKLNGQFGSVTQ